MEECSPRQRWACCFCGNKCTMAVSALEGDGERLVQVFTKSMICTARQGCSASPPDGAVLPPPRQGCSASPPDGAVLPPPRQTCSASPPDGAVLAASSQAGLFCLPSRWGCSASSQAGLFCLPSRWGCSASSQAGLFCLLPGRPVLPPLQMGLFCLLPDRAVLPPPRQGCSASSQTCAGANSALPQTGLFGALIACVGGVYTTSYSDLPNTSRTWYQFV